MKLLRNFLPYQDFCYPLYIYKCQQYKQILQYLRQLSYSLHVYVTGLDGEEKLNLFLTQIDKIKKKNKKFVYSCFGKIWTENNGTNRKQQQQ